MLHNRAKFLSDIPRHLNLSINDRDEKFSTRFIHKIHVVFDYIAYNVIF